MKSERIIGLIGSGAQRVGIAQAAATAGFIVELRDANQAGLKEAQAEAIQRIEATIQRGGLSPAERDAIVGRLRIGTDLADLAKAECVIETTPEDLATKRKTLQEIDKAVSPRALIATSTDTFSVTKLAEGLKRSSRFVGMNFLHPAHDLKAVELVWGPQTAEQTLVDARAICVKMGLTPVKVKDSAGFISARVSRPFFLEAIRLAEAGEADIATIDAAVKGFGAVAQGPFELLDRFGLDNELRKTDALRQMLDNTARFASPAVLGRLVSSGHTGRKAGRGFYEYSDSRLTRAFEVPPKDVRSWQPSAALCDFARVLHQPENRETWIFAHILVAVVNEAAMLADVIASARDVNLAMELGYGFTDGPIAMADHIGLDIMRRLSAEFYEESGRDERYAPNAPIDQLVKEGFLGEKTARGFLHHSL